MTIIPRTHAASDRTPAETGTPGVRPITLPGTGARVDHRAPVTPVTAGHTIDAMTQLVLPIAIAQAMTTSPADTRSWAYERALDAAAAELLWWDNRSNLWTWHGDDTTASYLFGHDERATRELCAGGFLHVLAPKTDMPATDQRTLRVRRVALTDTGTELHRRWAALAGYTA